MRPAARILPSTIGFALLAVSSPAIATSGTSWAGWPAARDAALAAPIQGDEKPAAPAAGEPAEGGDAADLAKKLSNPISSLISVPFQFNYDEGFGPREAGRWLLNIQPVIPFSLDERWNVITRTIVPVIYQESPADGAGDEFGLGDTLQSFFFSPKESSPIWGIGPAFLWPTATANALGSEKWGAGPTIVVLQQSRGFTYGALANHIWSYAGDDDRPYVSQTFLQPFVAHTFPSATTLTLNTESSYDWRTDEWTVPINLQLGQVLKIGNQPVQFQIGGRYYADSPPGGPEWGVRFAVIFMFPVK